MAVKGNREALQAACKRVAARLVFGEQTPHVVTETGHGRISTWSTDLAKGDKASLPYAARLAVIRRDIADLAGQPISKEIVLMVTSRTTMTSTDFHTCTRGHWGIDRRPAQPRPRCPGHQRPHEDHRNHPADRPDHDRATPLLAIT